MAGHVQKQPAPSSRKRSPWAPEKSKRETGTLERHGTRELDEPLQKKKQKPKTAPAGGGAKPPSKPPKGPTGGDNKGPKDEGRRPDYKGSKDTDSGMSLRKSYGKEKTKNSKPKDKQFKDSNYNRPMGGLTKSTKKEK
jgi:hypothetical protein